jgi:hypothetical protein
MKKKYDEIAEPIKIGTTTDDYQIYFTDKNQNIRKFSIKKFHPKKYKKIVNNGFNKVQIDAKGFCWKAENDIDEVYLGKDTIYSHSHRLTFNEAMDLLGILYKKGQLKVKDLEKILDACLKK